MCEDLTGWMLNEEILEAKRHHLAEDRSQKPWMVRSPEILEKGLQRVSCPVSATEYLLTRLGDCIAYPSLESPQIRARFDLLRRELLVRSGKLSDAFSRDIPIAPAAECAGLLRSIIEATGVPLGELAAMLEHDTHLVSLPGARPRLLAQEESP
jgi:hypothetical protein